MHIPSASGNLYLTADAPETDIPIFRLKFDSDIRRRFNRAVQPQLIFYLRRALKARVVREVCFQMKGALLPCACQNDALQIRFGRCFVVSQKTLCQRDANHVAVCRDEFNVAAHRQRQFYLIDTVKREVLLGDERRIRC